MLHFATEVAPESHFWEMVLALSTIALVAVTAVLIIVTMKVTMSEDHKHVQRMSEEDHRHEERMADLENAHERLLAEEHGQPAPQAKGEPQAEPKAEKKKSIDPEDIDPLY